MYLSEKFGFIQLYFVHTIMVIVLKCFLNVKSLMEVNDTNKPLKIAVGNSM